MELFLLLLFTQQQVLNAQTCGVMRHVFVEHGGREHWLFSTLRPEWDPWPKERGRQGLNRAGGTYSGHLASVLCGEVKVGEIPSLAGVGSWRSPLRNGHLT